MDTRETMLQLIPLAMKRIQHEGRPLSVEDFLDYVADRDCLDSCTDEELFAVVRALYAYDAFADVRVVQARDDKVVYMAPETTQGILELDGKALSRLLFGFSYRCERKGLQCSMEEGLLATWLRMLRLWDASLFPGVDNLTAAQARQAR